MVLEGHCSILEYVECFRRVTEWCASGNHRWIIDWCSADLTSRSKHGLSSIATQTLTFWLISVTIALTMTFRARIIWLQFLIFLWCSSIAQKTILFAGSVSSLARNIRNSIVSKCGLSRLKPHLRWLYFIVFRRVSIYLRVIGIRQCRWETPEVS